MKRTVMVLIDCELGQPEPLDMVACEDGWECPDATLITIGKSGSPRIHERVPVEMAEHVCKLVVRDELSVVKINPGPEAVMISIEPTAAATAMKQAAEQGKMIALEAEIARLRGLLFDMRANQADLSPEAVSLLRVWG